MDRRRLLLAIAAQSATWKDEAFSPLNGSLAPAKAKGPFKLGKLIGRTLAVNQLINDDFGASMAFWNKNRVTQTNSGNVGTFVSNSNAYNYVSFYHTYPAGQLVKGHKYLMRGEMRITSGLCSEISLAYHTTKIARTSNPSLNVWYALEGIFENTRENTVAVNAPIFERAYSSTSDIVVNSDAFQARNIKLYDLTLMFGPGREPTTIDEFKKVYSRENTAYTLGQLESSLITSIIARKTDSTEKSRLELPNDLTIKSALDAKDTFEVVGENAVFTKNVGTVDLGTLNWTHFAPSGQTPYFRATLADLKVLTNDGQMRNMMCVNYTTSTWSAVYSTNNDKIISSVSTFVIIRDTSYNGDATAFKTAMAGQYLNYELATPQTITIPLKKLQAVTIGELNWYNEDIGGTVALGLFRTDSLQNIIKGATDNYAIGNLYTSEIISGTYIQAYNLQNVIAVSTTGSIRFVDKSCATLSDFLSKYRDDVIWFESVNDQAEWNAGTCDAGGEFETGYVSPDAVLKIYEKK